MTINLRKRRRFSPWTRNACTKPGQLSRRRERAVRSMHHRAALFHEEMRWHEETFGRLAEKRVHARRKSWVARRKCGVKRSATASALRKDEAELWPNLWRGQARAVEFLAGGGGWRDLSPIAIDARPCTFVPRNDFSCSFVGRLRAVNAPSWSLFRFAALAGTKLTRRVC